MSRPIEVRDTKNEWQSVIRFWMVGKDISIEDAAQLVGVSKTTVKRLLALPHKGTSYGRKRWRANFLNQFMFRIGLPTRLQILVNRLAAKEEGYVIE